MKFFAKSLIALALVIAMTAAAGCSLVSKNEEKDMAQTVATVNGVPITKKAFKGAFEEIAYYYSMFGMQLSEDNIEDVRGSTMDSIVMDEVLKQKARELGYDKLTDEETAQIDQDFNDQWQAYVDSLKSQAEAEKETNPNLDVDKRAEELVLEQLAKQGVTKESLKQNSLDQKMYEKLRDAVYAEINVTDADIKAAYDQKLADQKAQYAETPESYESDARGSSAIAYVPPGYIRVKHVLVAPEEDDAAYTAKMDELSAAQTELAQQMTDLIVEDKTANQAKIDELEQKINASKQEQATMREGFLAKLKPEADEALAKALAGEDFDKLVETYGKDPGMQSSPQKETGYLMHEKSSYAPEFLAASFALQNVGDISPLVATEFGYHIIKLVEKVRSGDVSIDEIKDAILEEVKSSKQSELWSQRQDEWNAAADIKTFPNLVSDIGLE